MDNSKIKILIDELIQMIKSSFTGFKGIYHFGSRNNNSWNDDSDVDLLIAFDRDLNWKEKRELKNRIYDIELKYDYLLDTKIFNYKDIEKPLTPFREQVKNNSVFYAV